MRGMRHFLAALLTAALLLSLAACGSTNSAGQLRLYYPAELSTKSRSTGGGDAIASVQVDWQQIGGDQLGRQQQTLRPLRHPDIRIRQPQAQLTGGVPVIQHRQLGVKLPGLPLQQVHLAVGGKGRHGKAQLTGHLEGLAADGAGGAQQGDGFCHERPPLTPPGPAAGRTAPGRQTARCRTGPARRRGPAAVVRNP